LCTVLTKITTRVDFNDKISYIYYITLISVVVEIISVAGMRYNK